MTKWLKKTKTKKRIIVKESHLKKIHNNKKIYQYCNNFNLLIGLFVTFHHQDIYSLNPTKNIKIELVEVIAYMNTYIMQLYCRDKSPNDRLL